MSEAINNPVKRTYKNEIISDDFKIGQKADIDLDKPLIHGESLADIAGDVSHNSPLIEALAFAEEPVTILIAENSRSDFPESHVSVAVQGKGAEIFQNGRWLEIGWLPIGQQIITKRKYVELLGRSKSDSISTKHEDANVERPRNTLSRRTSANYPISILEDRNPKGAEWFSRVVMGY